MLANKDDRYTVAAMLLVAALCIHPSDTGPMWPYVVTVGSLITVAYLLLRK